jgi:RecB family exonuclease
LSHTQPSLGGFAAEIPIQDLVGLRPRAWLCVGAGFSREDLKALLLNRGYGFTGDAITNLPAIALKLVTAFHHEVSAERVLSGSARQEVLRLLLAEPKILARLPELKRLRRQSGFFKRLDYSMQAARMAFAHDEEGAVYAERLAQRLGSNPLRGEMEWLSMSYEAWLEGSQLWDPPRVLRRATQLLNEEEWPRAMARPEAIHSFSVQTEESLERALWEALARHVVVQRVGPLGALPTVSQASHSHQLWHTLDDAADELADELARLAEEGHALEEIAVLISDTASVRRSLKRALEARGIPLADPRDPTRLKWDEGLKWATLSLELVARRFERDTVVSYLRSSSLAPAWVNEIHLRGIRLGLESYAGGFLSDVHAILSGLQQQLGGRKTCANLGEAHLAVLRKAATGCPDRYWLVPFFEAVWKEFARDMERVGQAERAAPILYWWERLQSRLQETASPVERAKPEHGVAVYRLQYAPLVPYSRVFVLGLPSNWLAGDGLGDYWFSERERETLSGEFAVRSGLQVRHERVAALTCWVRGAEQVVWLDAAYDADGRERESIEAVLKELGVTVAPEERGAHPRWLPSYGAFRPTPPQDVQLSALPQRPGGLPPEITATAIDSYSRCSMQAMAYHRWRLREVRESDLDLWPEARGNILHEAVKLLLTSRSPDGNFALTPAQALEQAWVSKRPKGLIRGARAAQYVRSRLMQVLETFCEKEREYFNRAPSRVISLDDTTLRLDYPDFAMTGVPDRIDEHPEGLFVIDYKTSSSLPYGSDMVELGYRLQLPFYALAARKQLNKEVMGVQFIELGKKGGRGNGIFFKKYNGKEPGKPTVLRGNSKSLLASEPEETWARLEESLISDAKGLVAGRFSARPKRGEKECLTCRVSDFCGLKRRNAEAGGDSE